MALGVKPKKNTEDSRCRYGCEMMESMYHVFIVCEKFRVLREEVRCPILRKVEKRFNKFNVEESHVSALQEVANFFFCDSDIWPLQNLVYYLGQVPKLDPWVFKETFDRTTIHASYIPFMETFTWWEFISPLAYGD